MNFAGKNTHILRKAFGYNSVAQFEIAIDIPEKRMRAWGSKKVIANPKDKDSEKLAKFFGITQEELREHEYTEEEALALARKMRGSKKGDKLGVTKNGISILNLDEYSEFMVTLLKLSVSELQELQKQQQDIEKIKVIQEVITFKQRCEALETQVKLQADVINLLNEKISNMQVNAK